MLRNLEGWHFVVLLVVILLLFGSKKLPDAARGVGRSLRIFKSEMKSMQDDDTPSTTASAEPVAKPDPGALRPSSDSSADSGAATPTADPAQRETPPRVDG